jgi:hypothetical protein
MAEYFGRDIEFVSDGDKIELPKPGEIHCIVKFPVYGPLPQVFRVYVDEKRWYVDRVN